MDFQVELLKTIVRKLDVEVNVTASSAFQITTKQTASVFEPTDSEDSTVMVKADFKLCDENDEKLLFVNMTTDFIFKFDPIPEKRPKAVFERCWDIMRKKNMDIAVNVLENMGHTFAICDEAK